MKIYFAASIRGGRDDDDLYRALIIELARFGNVLTEHITHPNDVEQGMTDRQIYERDMGWLREAEVVVAEVTTPSLGVGYELASAQQLGKRILCLFRPSSGQSLSAMISGAEALTVVEYETLEEATTAIETFLI
ncbi:MAG: nucleoside 2-deoxyribosyltransferase [Acidimicrobiia bacterium]